MFHRRKNGSKGTTFDTIGACPECGNVDGYYNYGPNHFFVCFKHKAQWLGAYDLFSTWRKETTDDWINNRVSFEEYRSVLPSNVRKLKKAKVYYYIKPEPDIEWL